MYEAVAFYSDVLVNRWNSVASMIDGKLRRGRSCRFAWSLPNEPAYWLKNKVHDPIYIRIQEFLAKVGAGRTRRNAKPKAHTDIDLLFADVPENLPVPVISTSECDVPAWNQRDSNYFKDVFSFAEANLHDDAVLLIHPLDSVIDKSISKWAKTCGFYLATHRWGLNKLRLTSSKDSHLIYPVDSSTDSPRLRLSI